MEEFLNTGFEQLWAQPSRGTCLCHNIIKYTTETQWVSGFRCVICTYVLIATTVHVADVRQQEKEENTLLLIIIFSRSFRLNYLGGWVNIKFLYLTENELIANGVG